MLHEVRHDALTGTYFFTFRLLDQGSDLLIREINLLRDITKLCRKRWPFTIDAAVILPSVAHMIWTLPPGDIGCAMRLRMIEATFSRHVQPSDCRVPEGDTNIWQRRQDVHQINDRGDFQRHMHVIAFAPVRAGLVDRPRDWPYGSWRRTKATAIRTIDRVPSIPDPAIAANAN